MSPEKDERAGEGGSVLKGPIKKLAPSNICENDSKTMQDEEEVVVGLENMSVAPGKVPKHPLENAWTLWFFKNDKSRTWEENQRPIITVTTVEDFWSLYNHIETPSKLPPGSDYSLFKEGIFPDWEDPRNAVGGRWMIGVDRQQRSETLDSHWLEILFFLIGEHADCNANQVNGAVVNVRSKGDKLAVWVTDSANTEAVMKIGKMVKERLEIPENQTIVFNVHKEEKTRPGGNGKRRMVV